jgi:ABC-type sugar transport system ATPase subunit
MPTTTIASAKNVVKQYPGVLALDHVSFSISAGEVRALLGRNGAGKSTLIRLFSGVERPDEGVIEIGGRALTSGGINEASARGVATVYQELSLIPQMTVAENFYLGAWPKSLPGIVNQATMKAETRAALAELGLDIDPDLAVEQLPVAEQQMVEIARALRTKPQLLILDEPTSALPASEVQAVLEAVRRIAASGVAVIYVSHRMDEIHQVANTATVMRDGRIINTVDIAHASTEEIVQMMLGSTATTARMNTSPQQDVIKRNPVLLSVRHLCVPPNLVDVSLDVHAGEVLGLAGVLGSGRTELLRCLSGLDRAASGDIIINGKTVSHPSPIKMLRLGVGLTPEDRKRDGTFPFLSVEENIVMARWPTIKGGLSISAQAMRQSATHLSGRLSIKASSMDIPIATLSGGNQQKALIARWLHAGVKILLLDEPTRGVDVEAKGQIYGVMRDLAREGVGIIFVSSELEELVAACDRVLVLCAGSITKEFSAPGLSLDQIMAATISGQLPHEVKK